MRANAAGGFSFAVVAETKLRAGAETAERIQQKGHNSWGSPDKVPEFMGVLGFRVFFISRIEGVYPFRKGLEIGFPLREG